MARCSAKTSKGVRCKKCVGSGTLCHLHNEKQSRAPPRDDDLVFKYFKNDELNRDMTMKSGVQYMTGRIMGRSGDRGIVKPRMQERYNKRKRSVRCIGKISHREGVSICLSRGVVLLIGDEDLI